MGGCAGKLAGQREIAAGQRGVRKIVREVRKPKRGSGIDGEVIRG